MARKTPPMDFWLSYHEGQRTCRSCQIISLYHFRQGGCVFRLVGLSVCWLRKNHLANFHRTWWRGGARAKEESIQFWSGLRGFSLSLTLQTGGILASAVVCSLQVPILFCMVSSPGSKSHSKMDIFILLPRMGLCRMILCYIYFTEPWVIIIKAEMVMSIQFSNFILVHFHLGLCFQNESLWLRALLSGKASFIMSRRGN